ncbi:MAG TPA: complex I NDUFA9 subunit family protein [Alphaproteobacteria bacterium]|nr:complex I NDUFA9 subunit family protein [Alphaproteobacteria bacterium]HAJ45898.1 complex I NDUFA9 subunit family protein [Alphaproteobacteria bacterium]
MAKLVTVFGGSGFVGRHVVARLAKTGARIRVAVRNPLLANRLYPMGDPGQIAVVRANLADERQVATAVSGADTVINLVGILFERGRQRFETIQAEGAGALARQAKLAGATSFVQMSAIGADAASPSLYARTKAQGEALVQEAFPNALILRPSIIFGPEDGFFNRFASIATWSPILPLFGGGVNRMQPVYVGDVADAVMNGLQQGAAGVHELGGPRIFTFRELMVYVCEVTGRTPFLVSMPFSLGHLGAFFAEFLPTPPLTRDQLRLLASDNVVADGARTLAQLSIQPVPVEAIVPRYLYVFRKAGQFTDLRNN